MARILILIGGHVCNAPRPQKEADALAAAGHEVIVGGFWFDPEFISRDRALLATKLWRFEPIVDFQPTHRWNNFWIRLQGRIAKERFLKFQTFSPNLLGFSAKAMLRMARNIRADLTIVHSELGLWVGSKLLDEGFRVGVDFEDWFSEDLPAEARKIRPLAQIKALEARLIRDCHYCLTTSHAMAEAMSTTYQAPKPTVIYNSFPWAERSQLDQKLYDRQDANRPSIHWFSQTIGTGRGLETLFQALPHLDRPIEIHLRGNYPDSARQQLETQIPNEWRNYLFIHPTVANDVLLSRIAEHDIGLALEIPYCSNKQFTTSNKMFQYLQAGLAVIATDTAGQQEVFDEFPQIGQLVASQNPIALAQALNEFLHHPEKLAAAKQAALEAAQSVFAWETQAAKVVQLAKAALA